MEDFIKEYKNLLLTATEYMDEILARQKKYKHLRLPDTIYESQGISVSHVYLEDCEVWAEYKIDEGDCYGSYYLNISDHTHTDKIIHQLDEKAERSVEYSKKAVAEFVKKEILELARLQNKYGGK